MYFVTKIRPHLLFAHKSGTVVFQSLRPGGGDKGQVGRKKIPSIQWRDQGQLPKFGPNSVTYMKKLGFFKNYNFIFQHLSSDRGQITDFVHVHKAGTGDGPDGRTD